MESSLLNSEVSHLSDISPAKDDVPKLVTKKKYFLYLFTLVSAIGGFLFGYDTGVVSGAILLIAEELSLTDFEVEMVVSSTIFSAFVAAVFGSFLNEKLGRHVSIMISSMLFGFGSLILAFSQTFVQLIIGRVVVGLGVGLSSLTVPIYISEASPPQYRGFLVTLNTLFVTGGQFIASVIDGSFSEVRSGWRYMLGIAFIPAFLQLIIFFFWLPKSPRWLLLKGREEEALQALIILRSGTDGVDEELHEIKQSLPSKDDVAARITDFLSHPALRKALILGCVLQFAQQTAGINNIMYYSPMIIKMSGFTKTSDAIWLSCIVSFSNFVFTPVGMYFVDKKGRRFLTLMSLVCVIVVIFLMGGAFLFDFFYSYPLTVTNVTDICSLYDKCNKCVQNSECGVCHSDSIYSCVVGNATSPSIGGCTSYEYSTCPSYLGWPILILLVLFLAMFAPGLGSMPWTINSEIFPLEYRSKGMAITSSVNWITNFVVSSTFLSLINALKAHGVFFLYGGISLLNLLFLYKYLTETKGLTLEEIHKLFEPKPKEQLLVD